MDRMTGSNVQLGCAEGRARESGGAEGGSTFRLKIPPAEKAGPSYHASIAGIFWNYPHIRFWEVLVSRKAPGPFFMVFWRLNAVSFDMAS